MTLLFGKSRAGRYNLDVMSGQPSPRRVALVFLFVVWLASQPLVVGLSPSWGAVVPHEHLTRGTVTAAEWQAHLLRHLGIVPAANAQACIPANTHSDALVVASVPDGSGMLADFGLLVSFQDAVVRIPAIAPASARLAEVALNGIDRSDPPPTQPPNA